ncbi:trans-aconitate methyltransferase [Aquimarina sp. EL_43]|uniref:class I SAM-dependent methyltransferase n=1 Tax=unclassified Aquimarina TaxID=2627091 RepID=UPI0018C8E261|nr:MULTISPECIES: class I SAM-dependent methyltransferase [unclassified Aquimarina]MBG6130992.1 trans-aconitate methyltransferase [Aquimarina sp. EL_35]MBG6151451.1 trans-aconitate methyltransferase [Aquimarina sp. EL_32]MBG6169382.1 trans-aconitate methyltransferase [Aquimarina sp. EL_43]
MDNPWNTHYHYFDQKKHPPAATLRNALALSQKLQINPQDKQAVDLGCGNGVDTFALLQDKWNVLAIDQQNEALLRIKENTPDTYKQQLQLRLNSFENIDTLPNCQLINATFSLPFCHPDHFDTLWNIITSSISKKGIFSGHFFGTNDAWSSNPEMTFHTEKQIKAMFNRFDLTHCKEIEKQGKTISGKEKYWHVFHIVAQKK